MLWGVVSRGVFVWCGVGLLFGVFGVRGGIGGVFIGGVCLFLCFGIVG